MEISWLDDDEIVLESVTFAFDADYAELMSLPLVRVIAKVAGATHISMVRIA